MNRVVRGRQAHKSILFSLLTLFLVLINLHVLYAVLYSAFSPPPKRFDVMQREGRSHRLNLNKSVVIGQTFHCDIDNLDMVAVKFHTRAEYKNCQILFRLKSAANPQTNLVRLIVPGNDVRDEAYHLFKFPALANSKGKDYVFLLEAIDERGFAGINCYHTDGDVYAGGTAIENGRPLPMDLAFVTGSS
jgi:hypothetical protein